jgi:hypothetical protein
METNKKSKKRIKTDKKGTRKKNERKREGGSWNSECKSENNQEEGIIYIGRQTGRDMQMKRDI